MIGRTGLGPGEFNYPRCAAVCPATGLLWVIDKAGRVSAFDAEGQCVHLWRMPNIDNGKPVGLTVDADGTLWIADTHEHSVVLMASDGREIRRFGSVGTQAGQFIFPTDVVLTEREVFVSEYGQNDRIQVFDRQGTFLRQFAGPGTGDAALNRPQGMVRGPDGRLYVADAVNHRVAVYSAAGEFVQQIGRPGTQRGELRTPYGLAFLPDGTLVIAENNNHRLQRFTTQGESLGVWGSCGYKPGQLIFPWGVELHSPTTIAVVDSGNNRVQIIDWRTIR